MPHTLLIWQEVPENTRLFLIPNEVADKFREYLTEAQNRLINSDVMNNGMRFLNTALYEFDAEDGFEEHLGDIDFSRPVIIFSSPKRRMAMAMKLRWSKFFTKAVEKTPTSVEISPQDDGWDVITRNGSRRSILSDNELDMYLKTYLERG